MAGARPRILVVDSEPATRLALCELLDGEGYDVTGAATSTEALTFAEVQVFDAVLVDLGLPEVDGLNLVRVVRSRPDRPMLLVFTGHHRLQQVAEDAGADAFILKPAVRELLAALKVFISARKAVLLAGRKVAGDDE
jgi:CheY-like chemotaxis protein